MLWKKLTQILVIASYLGCSVAFAKASLSSLEKLVSAGSYSQAWQQAQQLAKTHEGNPRFDYLYGISALETGNYNQALFALDRVTVNQPNVIRPRLELARAYLKVNNDKAALREFKETLRLNPPPTVRRNINRYIQAMTKSSNKNRKWIMDGLISLAGGYDSNANFGASSALFDIPVFGSVRLNDQSLEQDSPFTQLRGQLNYRYITSESQSWFIKTNLSHKHFAGAQAFNLSELVMQAGSIKTVGKQQYQISAQNSLLRLDNSAYSNTLGVVGAVAHELSNNRVISGSITAENYDHKQQNLRDAKRYQLAGQYRFDVGKTRHQLSLSLSHEVPKHEVGKQHTVNGTGVGYTARHTWNETQTSFLSLHYQDRRHRANNPIYGAKRSDDRLALKLGHSVRLSKASSAFADVNYIKNDSNLDIYTSDKSFVRVGINYHF